MKHLPHQHYDVLAQQYDSRWKTYVQTTLQRLISSLALKGTEAILDVACGTGELERLLHNIYPAIKITGVDPSAGMLEVARAKLLPTSVIQFIQGDANSLPCNNGQFDVVLTASAFHYFPDPVAALREMQRTLHPDGKIIILDWCRDYWLCAAYDVVLKLIDKSHAQCYTVDEMRGFAAAASLPIVGQEKFRTSWLWGMMQVTLASPQSAADRLLK